MSRPGDARRRRRWGSLPGCALFTIYTISAITHHAPLWVIVSCAVLAVATAMSFVAENGRGLPAPVTKGRPFQVIRQVGFWQTLAVALGFTAATVLFVLWSLGVVEPQDRFRTLAPVGVLCGVWIMWMTWGSVVALFRQE